MSNNKARVWISTTTPKLGELVRVRALVTHRMETGFRLTGDGKAPARNIIHIFEVKLNDQLLFSWSPETAISQNPYIEFTFRANQAGRLSMQWTDDEGQVITDDLELSLSA